MSKIATYAINLCLTDELVVVVGAGSVGMRKIHGLLPTKARIVVVEPAPHEELCQLQDEGALTIERKGVTDDLLEQARLVFVCTNDHLFNQDVASRCHKHRVLCNVVDDPDNCSFTVPSVVQRLPLQIAISTNGTSPALAKRLRIELEQRYGQEYAQYAELMGQLRKQIYMHFPHPCAQRSELLHACNDDEIFESVIAGTLPDSSQLLQQIACQQGIKLMNIDEANLSLSSMRLPIDERSEAPQSEEQK